MHKLICNLCLILLKSLLLLSIVTVDASAEKSSVLRENKTTSFSAIFPIPISVGLEMNYYLDHDTQVGLVAAADSIFVAGHAYASAHYTKFMSNSFFIRTQAGYWAGHWGVGREGPATTVVFGHEWLSEDYTWGIEYGGIGAVFDFKNGPDLAFSFPHLKAGLSF